MRAVVVYESMYGNTHVVADHIAAGLQGSFEVVVMSVEHADDDTLESADLLVVGGPTHAHGMASTSTRKAAVDAADKDDDLELDPDAEGPGFRDWLGEMTKRDGALAAAFDTRIDAPAALTGRASKGIARRLHKHGFELVADPESFLVDKHSHLLDGEQDRAQLWGASIAALVDRPSSTTTS